MLIKIQLHLINQDNSVFNEKHKIQQNVWYYLHPLNSGSRKISDEGATVTTELYGASRIKSTSALKKS